MSNVYNNDDRTVYIALTDSIDVDGISLEGAHEFPGVANAEAVGGRLLVSSGEAPTITEYTINDDLEWTEGETVSFGAFPLADNANFFYQYLVDDHHMYMPFEGYKRIVWDPTDFEIEAVMEDTQLEPELGGLQLEAAGNRSGIRYDGAVLTPFFYRDDDWFEFGPSSPIAVYDPKTHEETKVIDAPCAGLAIASQDEAGNTYFSTWDYGPLRPLYGQGPAPCVVRITPERELDADFTTDMTAWTGGRYVSNFRYIRDGWGLANVFHHERVELDFSADTIDPEATDLVWEEANWSVWLIDLEHQSAQPFEAIDLPGFGWGSLQIDGRSFLTVVHDDDSRTQFYELDDDGDVREHFDVAGDASLIRVR